MTLEQVRGNAAPDIYPRHVLEPCLDALVLFAAGFHGSQDAIWCAEAGLQATCVDLNHERLGEMVLAYPEGWEYVHADAYAYIARTLRTWDVVTVDCSTGAFDRCAALASTFCGLANRTVVLGSRAAPELDLPDGWRVTDTMKRTDYRGGTFWTVIGRC